VAKKKLIRFAQLEEFVNVIQPNDKYPVENHPFKDKWNELVFKNNNPVILEIGCGKGEYSLELARQYPNKNFIGIDIKGERIWKGAKQANDEKLHNIVFLRIQAERINYFFGENEISGIWITFPDPQLRGSRAKKRLTSPKFLERYKPILQAGSPIHLKTDNDTLFEYTLEVISEYNHKLVFATKDLYTLPFVGDQIAKEVESHYESIYRSQGIAIKYLQFVLNE
jgi:tRNA (guanine-N7-)-methyltransferase